MLGYNTLKSTSPQKRGPMNTALWLIGISLLAWGLGEGMFFVFVPIYLIELGASPILIGSILGASGASMAVAHIFAGYLSDRIGSRPLLRAAWVLGLLAAAMMALARNLFLFVPGLVLYGFTAFVIAPLNSYITTARGKLTPARAMTLTSAFYNTGAIAGPLLGGWIGSQLGLHSVYFFSTAIFALSTALIFFLRPQPLQNGNAHEAIPLWKNKHYALLLGLAFLLIFFTYLPQPLTPNFLTEHRKLSLTSLGLLNALNNVGNVVLNLGLGHLDPYFGLSLAQGAVAFFTLAIWQGHNMLWYGIGFFLLSGYRVARPLLSARVRAVVHESQMGLAYGFLETINSLPLIIAPPLAGLIYTYRPEWIYPISLVGILVTLLLSHNIRKG